MFAAFIAVSFFISQISYGMNPQPPKDQLDAEQEIKQVPVPMPKKQKTKPEKTKPEKTKLQQTKPDKIKPQKTKQSKK